MYKAVTCSALDIFKMHITLGIERELAQAECGKRVHCLAYVVALDGSSLPHSLRYFHLVITAKSYQFKPIAIHDH